MTVILSRICVDGEVNHNNGYGKEVQLLLNSINRWVHSSVVYTVHTYYGNSCLNAIPVMRDGICCSGGTLCQYRQAIMDTFRVRKLGTEGCPLLE